MKKINDYYPASRYEVLESKRMIMIYRKTIFGNLRWIRSCSKEYYSWTDDNESDMYIVTQLPIKEDK